MKPKSSRIFSPELEPEPESDKNYLPEPNLGKSYSELQPISRILAEAEPN